MRRAIRVSRFGHHVLRLHDYGIVRLIGQVRAIPGRIKLTEQEWVVLIRLRREHHRAGDVCQGFLP